jgi:flagellar motor switch protein FliM
VPGGDPAIAAILDVATPFGDHPVHLLVHRVGRWDSLVRAEGSPKPETPGVREQMESLVREMPVELEIVLGSADLTMHDVAALRAGDVIVLQQKVNQPLDGLVSGTRKFRVWPGAIGPKAAILIDAHARD